MAIYHLHVKIISRGKGQSVIASSAYRSGERLRDPETGLVHDYTKKRGVVFSEILLPDHAPRVYADRWSLWSAVQEVEKQSNAQLAREVEVALPIELSRSDQQEALRNYIHAQFVDEGMVADYSIHDTGDGNPHAHILLTTRPIKPDGAWGAKEKKGYALDDKGNRIPQIDPATGEQKLGKRNEKLWKRETVQANRWNDRSNIDRWREAWAIECNRYLDKEQQIDHRSHQDRGLEIEPTIHEGYVARKMEREGRSSERIEINRTVQERNQLLLETQRLIEAMREQLQQMIHALKKQWERIKAKERAFARQTQALNRRNQTVYGIDDLYPVLSPKTDVEPNTARRAADSQTKTERNRFGRIDDLRPVPELAQQRVSQIPRKQEKNEVEQLIESSKNEQKQTMFLTDWETFGFEIKQGEYLNVERYGYGVESHQIELLDENRFKWRDRECHKDYLKGAFRGGEVTKSDHKTEKEIECDHDDGFELE